MRRIGIKRFSMRGMSRWGFGIAFGEAGGMGGCGAGRGGVEIWVWMRRCWGCCGIQEQG